MSDAPQPPNPDLIELAKLLGVDNVRLLVRTFLAEYPALLEELAHGNRQTQHRVAHSLKSNSRVVGARAISAKMATIELRLADPTKPGLTDAEINEIRGEFAAIAGQLRAFATNA